MAGLAGVKVYPNPWRNRHAAKHVTFSNLPTDSTVKIFMVSGQWVRDLGPEAWRLETVVWDLKNHSGDKVASGVYLYLITDASGGRVRGKLAIVR